MIIELSCTDLDGNYNHGLRKITPNNFQMPYNNTNFLNTNNSTSNYPQISPSGGNSLPMSNSLPLQTSCRAGNANSASATNQSNPPTLTSTDQNTATSPARKSSKKVISQYFSNYFCTLCRLSQSF